MITLQVNGEELIVLEFIGREALGKPFRFTISCLTPTDSIETIYLDQFAILNLNLPSTIRHRKVAGMITTVSSEPISYEQSLSCFTLQPRLAKLITFHMPQVKLKQSVVEVTEDLLQKAGYTTSQWKFILEDHYPVLDYWAQHFIYGQAESCLDWLQRYLSRAGISYYFAIENNDQEKIIFCDHNIAYCYDNTPIGASGFSKVGFHQLSERNCYLPDRYMVSDHDLMEPKQKICASNINPLFQNSSEYWEKQFYAEGVSDQIGAQKLAD